MLRIRTLLPLGLIVANSFMSCGQQPATPSAPVYTGDLPELRTHGVLRVIVRPEPINYLPRHAEQVTIDYDIARGLADALGLDLVLVVARDYSQMMQKLLGGEGDIVAASLTITETRKTQTAFSAPYLYVDEILIMAAGDSLPESLAELAGIEISARPSSSYYETLVSLQQQIPDLRIHAASETLSTERLVEGVAQGIYQATIYDSNFWNTISGYHDDLDTPLILAEDRPIGMMMRPEDTQLKGKVDEYLLSRALTRHRQTVFTDDLDGLKKRGRLRMITRNNAMTYFIHRGVQVGFEYDLMKKFAEQQGLRLEIVIPPSHADLMPYLNEGKGDIIAAAMTIDEARRVQANFTQPYNTVDEVVVVRADQDSITSPKDLAGRTVHVRKSSSFYRTLTVMQTVIDSLTVIGLPDDMETEKILVGVEEGIYDITLCDANLLGVEQTYGRPLKAAFSIKPTTLGWAVRENNSQLLSSLNTFIDQLDRSMYYNMLKKQYFSNTRTIAKALDSLRVDISGQLSPYDDLVKKYALEYTQDWRLTVAQMYQESRFDPNAISWVGALGLMQVMPNTGRDLGFTDLKDPDHGIHAGMKYMYQLINRFDPEIPLQARVRFALASYNVGYGHLLDARRLATTKGWDPNRWFDHVEKAMRLLQKPEYYTRARYGYCRGGQPVHYVRNIQDYYDAYVATLQRVDN